MKVIRSTRLSLKFANQSKLQLLSTILAEYSKVVNFFVGLFWGRSVARSELTKLILSQVETWLIARCRLSAAREALDLIHAAQETAKQRRCAPIMPIHHGKKMCLSSNNAELETSRTQNFDGWFRLRAIGNNIRLNLPIRGHSHFSKLKSLGRLMKYYVISTDYLQVSYEIDVGPKRTDGVVVGIDTGINALASLSTGEQYGSNVQEYLKRILRCKHGSKGQQRARRALRQFIDITAKAVVQGKRLVVVEDLRGLAKFRRRLNRNMRRVIGAWNYRYWLMRVQAACEMGRSRFASVAPHYTSQQCHGCGHIDKANRRGEVFLCKNCGHTDNADINAAKNILLRFATGPYGAGFKH